MSDPCTTLTLEEAKRLFEYDPETGRLTRRVLAEWSKSTATRYGGQEAGTADLDGRRFVSLSAEHGRIAVARVIWLMMTGSLPDNQIDHRNTDPSDNRWHNLRQATQAQNQSNKGPFKNNKTGLKGAYPHHRNKGRWFSTITIGKKAKYIGIYNCPVAAHLAYVVAANVAFGQFARGS